MDDMKTDNVVEEVTQQQEELPNKSYIEDKHKATDPYTEYKNTKEVDDKILENSIIIPTSNNKDLNKFVEDINNLDEEFIIKEFTEDQKISSRYAAGGNRYTTKNNVYVDNLNSNPDHYVNRIKYGDKNLNMKELSFTKEGSKMSPSEAALAFRTLLSIGEAVQVPLWHSGFWISLKPPTQTDIINLEIALTNSEIELGRDTNNLIYSNYAVVFNRIISDFIIKQIEYSTLKLPPNEDIRKYIVQHDYYPLVLGLIATMYPKGIHVTKGCINTIKLGDDNKPVCDFAVSGILDPKKLLWVDRTKLSPKLLTHMSNRLHNSVSVEDVIEYQNSIDILIDKTYELESEYGAKFSIKYTIPKLYDYIINGERWVNNIIKQAEGLYSESDTVDQKNNKINELSTSALLGVYNIFVKEIKYNNIVSTDFDAISDMLSTISVDDKSFIGFIKTIEEFITNSAISIVATPSYTCPTCNKNQTENKEGCFKEFIPFNIVEHFFVLSALRSEKTRNRIL